MTPCRQALRRITLLATTAVLLCGVEARADAPPQAAPDASAGRLRPAGQYLVEPAAPTVSTLPDGTVLLYGDDPLDFYKNSGGERVATLRNRREHPSAGRVDPGPKLWDPTRRGWRRLPAAPQCVGSPHLHTATTLPGGQVLIAGGLCDGFKMGDDRSPHAAHHKLSLWDAASRSWQAAPDLRQPRIHHSASLLPDGSVLLAGGQSDPALHAGPGEPVLASVELFSRGQVVELPALAAARARHTATVLPGGSVLVAGGFDATGQAIASAELWQPQSRTWRALPPLLSARQGHTATRLADGHVLVAGGVGTDGRALTAVEVWDPLFERWSAGPAMPQPLRGHSAALLASGDVLVAGGASQVEVAPTVWAWLWDKAADAWRPAGMAQPVNDEELARPVTLDPLPDGTARVFAARRIMRWEPAAGAKAGSAAPQWAHGTRPTAVALRDGRLMLVGQQQGDASADWSASLWDPAGDTWVAGGHLLPRLWRHARAIELPTGEVLHVGVDIENRLQCQSWQPAENRWRDCGTATLAFLAEDDITLALLPDGRAVAMADTQEVLVFDAARRQWQPAPVEWAGEGMAYGTPIRAAKPLARIRAPLSGQWLEVNDLAARHWQGKHGRRAHRVEIGGQVTRIVPGRGSPPALLWDAGQQHWSYVLLPGTMGPDAQVLPDGCVISSRPRALFNPLTGKVTPLTEPGIDMLPGRARMTVLRDGTVTFAGTAEGAKDAGAGFFQRRASCAGFEPATADADYMPGVLAIDPLAPVPAAAAGSAPPAVAERNRFLQALDIVLEPGYDRRWLLVALLLPLFVYAATRALRRKRPGSARPSRLWRVLVYGVLLALAVPAVSGWLEFRRGRALVACSEDARDCLDPKTGLLNKARDPAADGLAKAGSTIPCRFVGVWSSRQGSLMHRIELKDDGRYVMDASVVRVGNPAGYTGHWAVQGDAMVWRHEQGAGALDINPIVPRDGKAFTLIEGNGRRTEYELIRAVTSGRCTP